MPSDVDNTAPSHTDVSSAVDTSVNQAPVTNGHHVAHTDTDDHAIQQSEDKPSAAIAKPIEHLPEGIQPAAAFLPKDVAIHPHPTPPPEKPLADSKVDDDVEMTNGDDHAQQPDEASTNAAPAALSSETSLVRQRDEDDDGERFVKRSRIEDGTEDELALDDGGISAKSGAPADTSPPAASVTTTNVAQLPAHDETVVGSDTTGNAQVATAPPTVQTPNAEIESGASLPKESEATTTLPSGPDSSGTASASVPASTTQSVATSIEPTTHVPAPSTVTPASSIKYSDTAMTPLQKAFISEKMKNLKKTKHSIAFLRPVDHVLLNIPNYPEIIKRPMDLGTMESKLKADQYSSVQDFVNDFNQIIANVRRFNGDAHPVTQAGLSMEAYFKKMMETVPSPNAAAPVKQKKRSPSIGSKPLPRREPRAAATVAVTPTVAKAETFALQPDGTPQIRRDSTGRPARAIKPPQSRDLTYAKPKRKEALLELRFCEHVLDQIRSPKYAQVNSVFLYPVDPVALNIPHYRQIVKHPMDLSTMSQKLRAGEYGKASEFKKDFDLIVSNCLAFNPQGNPVRDMGVQFQRDFMSLWSQKERWEKANKPDVRGDSQSGDEESGDDDDEDDDDAGDDDKEATIQALQKQLETLQNTIMSMAGSKSSKPKKSKQKSVKKASSSAAPSKAAKASASKSKPKKVKQVTYEEKQEISEAVGRMDAAQTDKLTKIITENCERFRDMEEMELEIDDLPNDVQAMLLRYVRSIFGNPNKGRAASPDDIGGLDDDDFEPSARASAGGKRKKHKPMGKREQGEAIKSLQSKLAAFDNGGAGSGSDSPAAAHQRADSSSDEESEESEEE